MLYRRMSLIFESREKCHLWEGLMEKAISCTWEGFTFPSDIWSSILDECEMRVYNAFVN